MKKLYFNSYKISNKIRLDKIATFFKIHNPIRWKEYIVLEPEQIEIVLKYKPNEKQVYIFEFGSITFVNFDGYEIRIFLEFMESLIGDIDYSLFVKFHEEHTLKVYENGKCKLVEDTEKYIEFNNYIPHIISIILAKWVALYKVEIDIDILLDEATIYIQYLEKGLLHANTKKFLKIIAKLLKFEYEIISNIRIFDRDLNINQNKITRNVYDFLAEDYELYDRFMMIKNKIENLRSIINTYSSLSYEEIEGKQYYFEIFLLALFPISYIIEYLIDYNVINYLFKLLFK